MRERQVEAKIAEDAIEAEEKAAAEKKADAEWTTCRRKGKK